MKRPSDPSHLAGRQRRNTTVRLRLLRLARPASIGLAVCIAAMVILASARTARARAGGGHSFSGGGHSSGGGSHGGGFGGGGFGGGGHGGGSGSSIDLGDLLTFLYISHPLFGIPTTIVVVGLFYYASLRAKDQHTTRTIRRWTVSQKSSARRSELSKLRAVDPDFDESIFLARASHAFLKIQNAWSRQELESIRPFISDAVHERFALQFDEQKRLGFRNDMQNVAVSFAVVAGVLAGEVFDELSIRIGATALDQNVDLETGRREGAAHESQFEEVWTFLRRRGSLTRPGKAGLIEGNCPNCGGALAMNQSANCSYCGALLRSGQYDWVLSEISQQFEWKPRPPGEAPGVASLRRRDAFFNVQEMEDRASVIFWRHAYALQLKTVKPL